MTSRGNDEEEAGLVRAVSIKAARALNLLSENKTLAQELILKARKNMADFPKFCAECEAFGLTNTQVLMDIHQLIVKSTSKYSFTSAERLEPSTNTVGGLFKKRKSVGTTAQSEPHNMSRYGLNVLAKELKSATSAKKEAHSDYNDEGDGDVFARAKGYHHHHHHSSTAVSSGTDNNRNNNHLHGNSYAKTERRGDGVDEWAPAPIPPPLKYVKKESWGDLLPRDYASSQQNPQTPSSRLQQHPQSSSPSSYSTRSTLPSGAVRITMPRRVKQEQQQQPLSTATALTKAEPVTAETAHTDKKEDKISWDGYYYDKQDEVQYDREFYDAEEGGTCADLERDMYANISEGTAEDQRLTERQVKKLNAQRYRASEDGNNWENIQMMLSGVMKQQRATIEELNRDETEVGVQLLVHYQKPPFLSDSFKVSALKDPITPVRDPTSDMARFAREGSLLVRETRARKEREKGARARVDVAGTTLGDVLGVKHSESDEKGAEVSSGDNNSEKDKDCVAPADGETERAELERMEMTRKRESLPIFQCKNELMKIIGDNQVIVVIGETGSGKTTQLPQYFYEWGYWREGCIGCTQPRRVAAMSVAKRVSEEMGCELGGKVGYSIRFEAQTSPETVVKYMTDGILLRESLNDPLLDAYKAVIMDEAHERSLNTDILFGVLKKVAQRRRDFKLIVTSATMDAEKFASFFGGVPIFRIPGRTFPVDTLFSKTPCEDYVDAAVKQALTVHVSYPDGDILVFMTGQEDIEVTCTILNERLAQVGKTAKKLLVLPIYSQLPTDLQAKIFEPAPPGVRKCIVATNIAETSLTVDGIRYVIDTGYCKLKVYNPRIGMDALQVFPVSQQNAVQRAGRAGRTSSGVCFRMYTENAFKTEMLQATIPEIQRTNLANTVLLLKSLGIDDVFTFEFMDPPASENILNSMYTLWALGALDSMGALTKLGRRMAEFPIDPSLGKMLIVAQEMGCPSEVLTIVSMLSVPSVFYRPPERAEEWEAAHEKFFVPESDHLTLLNVYLQWKREGFSRRWCADNFIHPKAMSRAQEIREQLLSIMSPNGRGCSSMCTDSNVLRQVIASAYFVNVARLKGLTDYVNLRTGVPCHLHPTSALYGLGNTPSYVIYHELVLTTKEYMQCVTAVDPLWLTQLYPMFFSVKDSWESRQAKRKELYTEGRKLEEKYQDFLEKKKSAEQAQGHVSQASVPIAEAGAVSSSSISSLFKRKRKFKSGF